MLASARLFHNLSAFEIFYVGVNIDFFKLGANHWQQGP